MTSEIKSKIKTFANFGWRVFAIKICFAENKEKSYFSKAGFYFRNFVGVGQISAII